MLSGACAHIAAPSGDGAWAWPADPQAAFAAVEKRLHDARTVEIRAHITAGGALGADLEGELALASGNRARLDASGQLGASGLEASLVSDGKRARGGSPQRSFDVEAPATLAASLVVATTRMGIMYTASRLSHAVVPGPASGPLEAWLPVSDFSWLETDSNDLRALRFRVEVAPGSYVNAALWLDARDGLPVKRAQVISLGHGGDLQVVEEYEPIVLDGALDPHRFSLD